MYMCKKNKNKKSKLRKKFSTTAGPQKQQNIWQIPKSQKMLVLRNQPNSMDNHQTQHTKTTPKRKPSMRYPEQWQHPQSQNPTHSPKPKLQLNEAPKPPTKSTRSQSSWAGTARTSAMGTEMHSWSARVWATKPPPQTAPPPHQTVRLVSESETRIGTQATEECSTKTAQSMTFACICPACGTFWHQKSAHIEWLERLPSPTNWLPKQKIYIVYNYDFVHELDPYEWGANP